MMSLADLLSEQIRTIFLAEERFARAAPRLIESTSTPAFSRTVEELAVRATLRIRRLESIAESMSVRLGGQGCRAMDALLAECHEAAGLAGNACVCDIAIAYSIQRAIQHLLSSYAACLALAQSASLHTVAGSLAVSIEDICQSDERLVRVLSTDLFNSAPKGSRSRHLFRRRSGDPLEFAPD
ncbi:MAG: DUF892 family protein [Tepidisphaera sp.]